LRRALSPFSSKRRDPESGDLPGIKERHAGNLEVEDHPDAGLIYSDEDKIDSVGLRSNPFFKPDWNPELFLGQNFINHLGVYRTELLREIGGFREGLEVRRIFEEASGFDEVNLAISFNDIDFCLRLRSTGLQNVWTPSASLVHHESASRGHQRAPEEQAQFVREAAYMQRKWGFELLHDPFYNPNLSLNLPSFELAVPPRLPEFTLSAQ
jgi:GT2 family glycosyltransferase